MTQTSYAAILIEAAERFGSLTAVRGLEGPDVSLAVLHERALRLGSSLRSSGLQPGDRVAVLLENCVEYLELERATLIAGFAKVGINSRLSDQEAVAILRDSGASVLVTTSSRAQRLDPHRGVLPELGLVLAIDSGGDDGYHAFRDAGDAIPPPRVPEASDIAVLMYSSGTTGSPKGAAISQGAWAATATNMLIELPPTGPDDLLLHVAPMSHFGGCVAQGFAARGAAMVMLPRFDEAVVADVVERLQVTAMPLVPTMLQRLVVHAETNGSDAWRSLRSIPYGGAPIGETWLRRAVDVFGDVLHQMYGLSEAIAPITCLPPRGHRSVEGAPSRLATAGRPTPLFELRIVDEEGADLGAGGRGELLVRGTTVMSGYWRNPDATREVLDDDGWFRTGDIATLDADGYLSIVDRKRDLIITGGFNVTPGEVERVISAMPEVRQVVVLGVPHPDLGEAVMAVIIPTPGAEVDLESVQQRCRSELASYKKPIAIDVVDAIPENASGKLQRRVLEERYRGIFSDDAS